MMKRPSELEGIAATIQHYFDGMYHRDIGQLRKAFHPRALLFGHLSGKFIHLSLDEWLAMVESRPAPGA